jgi:hypothetical protein
MSELPPKKTSYNKPDATLDEVTVSNDAEIDKAIDDIQHTDSDTELDAAFAVQNTSEKRSLKQKYLDHKKWTIPLTILVLILIIVFSLPSSRYKIIGLFVSHTYTVTFQDSATSSAVSSATVHLDGATTTTDSSGKAMFTHIKPGSHQLSVTKQYYKTYSASVFVGISSPKPVSNRLVATGRQVLIHITNAITGKPLNDVDINSLGTSGRTNSSGDAHIVLPADKASASAKLNAGAGGFNEKTVTIQILNAKANSNNFQLVPAGHIYFLSNRSGKVDVVSTNYDGSNRQTLLAGTGFEDANNSQIYISPDQKYIALFTKRNNANNGAGLYILNTDTSKLSKVEESANVNITQIGWSGTYFVYSLYNYSTPQYQTGVSALKSYNAALDSMATLDQSQGEGDLTGNSYQVFSVATLIDGNVVYGTSWETNQPGRLDTKSDTINSIQLNGTNKKTLRSLTIPTGASYIALAQVLVAPEVSYFEMPSSNNDPSSGAIFFKYTKGGLTQTNNFTYANFTDQNVANGFITLSPSGSASLFQDSVDGHLVVSTGDSSGSNKQKIIELPSDGDVKGWLDNDYILIAQSNNQLYVIPASTSSSTKPMFVSDFLVPPHTNN